MKTILVAAALTLLATLAIGARAEASPRARMAAPGVYLPAGGSLALDSNGNDSRPRAWCGWWMRHLLGVSDKSYNLARQWSKFGQRASGPAVGVLVVWRHHVGIITGRTSDGWIVKSGNDGNAVRERERSLRGVIAYRWPHSTMAMQ